MRYRIEGRVSEEGNFSAVGRNLDEVRLYIPNNLPASKNDQAHERRQRGFLRYMKVDIFGKALANAQLSDRGLYHFGITEAKKESLRLFERLLIVRPKRFDVSLHVTWHRPE